MLLRSSEVGGGHERSVQNRQICVRMLAELGQVSGALSRRSRAKVKFVAVTLCEFHIAPALTPG
jgi:hypothetical protein